MFTPSNPKTREMTELLMDAVNGGLLRASDVLEMCMSYMSEYEVSDMCRVNDLTEFLKPEEENEDE